MAVEVVNVLEVVEIHHQHRNLAVPAGRARQERLYRRPAAAPVKAAGQRVDRGKLLRPGFCPAALHHFLLQVRITTPTEQQQGDVEEDGGGQLRVGRGTVA